MHLETNGGRFCRSGIDGDNVRSQHKRYGTVWSVYNSFCISDGKVSINHNQIEDYFSLHCLCVHLDYAYKLILNTGSCIDERGATHCTEAYPTTEEESETHELSGNYFQFTVMWLQINQWKSSATTQN